MSNGDKPKLAEQYRKRFAAVPGAGGNLESTGSDSSTAPMSASDIKDKAEQSREELYRIIRDYLQNDDQLKGIADKIAFNGRDALAAVADDDSAYLEKNPGKQNYLEVIVRTDGSRPSFLIKNDKVDKKSSPVGIWSDIIDGAGECLERAIRCVGRINDEGGFIIGTGFLVQRDIIVTNRHVLQAIATKENDGTWHIVKGTHIDFGHEHGGQATVNKRNLLKLIFCAPQYIDAHEIDHSKLDLVLIQLEPATQDNAPSKTLSVGLETGWSQAGNYIYTIGYPGNPGLDGLLIYSTLLEQLFKSTFGCKRLAPGMIIDSSSQKTAWTITHDATTLGGNSGSLIVSATNACVAAGIHYGGRVKAPRENWGHIFGHTMNSKNILEPITFKDCLEENKIIIV